METRSRIYAGRYLDECPFAIAKARKRYIGSFPNVRLHRTSDPEVFPPRLSQPILLDSPSPSVLQAPRCSLSTKHFTTTRHTRHTTTPTLCKEAVCFPTYSAQPVLTPLTPPPKSTIKYWTLHLHAPVDLQGYLLLHTYLHMDST